MTLLPALLLTLCPPTAILVWYTHTAHAGSLASLAGELARDGFFATVARAWGPIFFGSKTAGILLGMFAAVELVLMRVLPGRRFEGPITPGGNVPVYKANGVAAFVVTLALFCGGSFGLELFRASIVHDHFGEILGALNLFSLGFCLLLYLKGRFAPSTSDHGLSGNPIFDYYWGTELYPTVAGGTSRCSRTAASG